MNSNQIVNELKDLNVTNTTQAEKPSIITSYEYVNVKANNNSLFVPDLNKTLSTIEVLGRSSTLYNTNKAVVPELLENEFIYLSSTAETWQFSSDNANDTLLGSGARQIVIQGYVDANKTLGFEVINLNGLTGVTTVNSYYRLFGFQVISCGDSFNNNLGNIYLSPSTSVLTSGVPPLNEKIAVCGINDGVGYSSHIFVRNGGDIYFSELVISSGITSQTAIIELTFFVKTGGGISNNNFPWRKLASLNVSSDVPVISLHQSSFPSGSLNGLGLGDGSTDVMVVARRLSGNSDNVSFNYFLTGLEIY